MPRNKYEEYEQVKRARETYDLPPVSNPDAVFRRESPSTQISLEPVESVNLRVGCWSFHVSTLKPLRFSPSDSAITLFGPGGEELGLSREKSLEFAEHLRGLAAWIDKKIEEKVKGDPHAL